jgi:nucleotide-binding universal stress UspA family protein
MVHQIKRILYTTDLSESSITVFEQTVALAAQTGASIVMLHVIEDGSSGQQNRLIHLVDKSAYENIRQESRETIKHVLIGKQRTIPLIQNALKALCDSTSDKICGADNPVTIDGIEVKYGNVAEAIIEVCETAQCDLVAIGYYQKGSLLKALMGSAGKSLIQQSKKPIFLVPLEA